jgi:hypothetical protein
VAGFSSRVLLTPEIFFSFSCCALPVFRTCWSQIEARIFVSLSALPEFLFLVHRFAFLNLRARLGSRRCFLGLLVVPLSV